jgi:NRAMP (natural resistance-associated macrophage protein)-like metal ion transporter
MSNIFAIFLQSLCIKLGSVTGMDLAEMCKANCPPWLNYGLYIFAEAAIIATDIAEVIGTAIALNLLLKIPLVSKKLQGTLQVRHTLTSHTHGRLQAALYPLSTFSSFLSFTTPLGTCVLFAPLSSL